MAESAGSRAATLATLALILAMILWASSFIALKLAFRVYDPMVVIFARMLIASLCFLAIARRVTRHVQYQSGDYRLILFMAFCEPCLYFLFEAKAVVNTTASQERTHRYQSLARRFRRGLRGCLALPGEQPQ